MKNRFYILALAAAMAGCTGKAPKEKTEVVAGQPAESPQQIIEKYVREKGLKGSFTPSGLYVVVEEEGKGDFPGPQNTVSTEYTGYFLTGEVFDASPKGEPISFRLNGVIPGWTEGLQKFRKGGRGKLIIPPKLGYGQTQTGPIPPNSVLAFDVVLVDFK